MARGRETRRGLWQRLTNRGAQSDEGEPFTAGRFVASSWRQYAISYITVLNARLDAAESAISGEDTDREAKLRRLTGARLNLRMALDAASHTHSNLTGGPVERVWNNIHAAVVLLLELAPEAELPAWGADVLEFSRLHLSLTDPRRTAVERALLQPAEPKPLTNEHRPEAVNALKAAFAAASVEKAQARSFRNMVLAGTLALFTVAALLAFLGSWSPEAIPLCFPTSAPTACPSGPLTPSPDPATATATVTATAVRPDDPGRPRETTSPHREDPPREDPPRASAAPDPSQEPEDSNTDETEPGWFDVALVEILGLAAASLTAAVSLRKLRGSSAPYAIPMALTLLKLPAGAVSAVLGLMLINGGLMPGLDKLTTQGQILAWAALFGAGQEALTRFVDAKGREVLRNVRGPALRTAEPDDV